MRKACFWVLFGRIFFYFVFFFLLRFFFFYLFLFIIFPPKRPVSPLLIGIEPAHQPVVLALLSVAGPCGPAFVGAPA